MNTTAVTSSSSLLLKAIIIFMALLGAAILFKVLPKDTPDLPDPVEEVLDRPERPTATPKNQPEGKPTGNPKPIPFLNEDDGFPEDINEWSEEDHSRYFKVFCPPNSARRDVFDNHHLLTGMGWIGLLFSPESIAEACDAGDCKKVEEHLKIVLPRLSHPGKCKILEIVGSRCCPDVAKRVGEKLNIECD